MEKDKHDRFLSLLKIKTFKKRLGKIRVKYEHIGDNTIIIINLDETETRKYQQKSKNTPVCSETARNS